MTIAPSPVRPCRGGLLWARVLTLLLGASAAWVVASYSPEAPPLIECQVLKWTGRECPACGITRGLSALIHGRFEAAFEIYPFAFPVALGTLLAMIGALLPDRLWRRMMATRWIPWLLGLGASGTAMGILARWIWMIA